MDDESKARFEQERMREDLRLLYVALTRPRHALWLGFSAVKIGNGKACKTQQSAIGYLLGGPDEREAADWLQPLQDWASGSDSIALVPATDTTGVSRLASRGPSPALQTVPEYRADFDRHWGIASYSRLTRDLKKDTPQAAPVSPLSPLQVMRPADDESLGMAEANEWVAVSYTHLTLPTNREV